MTSHFDNLGSLHYLITEPTKKTKYATVIPLLDWLTSECIKQADTREPQTWTYAKWLERNNQRRKQINETVEVRKNDPLDMLDPYDLENRFEFLNDCHDFLDHRNWHLKVFDWPLAMVIERIRDALVEGRNIYGWDHNWQTLVRRHYPSLEALMLKWGFVKQFAGRGKKDYELYFGAREQKSL